MATLTETSQKRLTIQTVEIAADTTAIRSMDWERDRFDIEFGLENGTTYNSFIIQGEKTALIDTSHAKFRSLYLDTLQSIIDFAELDYLIVSHTEPDHSGLVKDIIKQAPHVTVVGGKIGIQFLENMVHLPFKKLVVKNGEKLDLGDDHEIEFISAPNLHWPDTIFSYDRLTRILFTCDAFGMHYCSDSTYDEDLTVLEAEYEFYYQCLMAPNARSVLSAMKRMKALPGLSTIATGHGPLLRRNLEEMTGRYERWSQLQAKAEKTVAMFFVSGYGHSNHLCQAIAHGITQTGIAVRMVDLKSADIQEAWKLVSTAAGIIISAPPVSDPMAANTEIIISTILASARKGQVFGVLESGGDDDLSIYPLRNKFRELGLKEAFPHILIKETPTEATYQQCEAVGRDTGKFLESQKKIKQIKSLDSDLEKALGRLAGGLYIITAAKDGINSAMVASWVTQTSFEPLGLTVAVAKERAIASLMQLGDKFVVNVLPDSGHQSLIKHFLKRLPPDVDRFAGVKTQLASNGSLILSDALAYIECEVASRMELSDHHLIYARVELGAVSHPDALPAVHHRQVGNHY